MKIITITHPTGDVLPILLDNNDFPLITPNEFILTRRDFTTNTLIRNLRELTVLFRWLEQMEIDLSSRIESKGKLFSEAEINGSLIEALRGKQNHVEGSTVVSVNTFNNRLLTVRGFFSWLFVVKLSSIPYTDVYFERVNNHKERVLKLLDSAFRKAPPSPKRKRKGLNAEEAKFLINSLEPSNPNAIGRNPSVRFRNYISLLILLHFGLRPGELLSLKVEDIVIGSISSINIERRPLDKNDKRNPQPRIKRNGRILTIDDMSLARSLDEYIMNYREDLESTSDVETDYLIISDAGEPLSYSSFYQLFVSLRKKFPNELPEHLSPKALRHTFSSNMERILRNAGIEEDKRRQALAELRGDSSLNSQDEYISQEVEDQVQAAFKKNQQDLLKGV